MYENGEFYYLEMNTRLQVEHPVTEMVTGLDLVNLQIRVAAGEELPFTQDDVTLTRTRHRGSHQRRGSGPTVPSSPPPVESPSWCRRRGSSTRWDGGYEAGDEISQYYDNLAGKLICWGRDRPTAIARTLRALREFRIEGVKTTIPADIAILDHPDFAAATHSTKWVEEHLDLSGVGSAPAAESTTDDGDEPEAKVRRDVDVEVNGKRFSVSMWVPESAMTAAAPSASTTRKPKRRSSTGGAVGGSGSGEVTVPMQGTVVKVLVEVGDEVEAGQTVIVLEAMKMENNVTAEKSGTIKEVRVEPGPIGWWRRRGRRHRLRRHVSTPPSTSETGTDARSRI